MTAVQPLDVKVVYNARSRGGGSRSYAVVRSGKRGGAWWIVGLINLVAACALGYVSLWQVDRDFLYDKIFCEYLVWKAPLPGIDVDVAAQAMFPGLVQDGAAAESAQPDSPPPAEPLMIAGLQATTVVGVAAVAWLTLAMVASCALSLAGGAAWGRAGGRVCRVLGMLLLAAAVVGLAWATYSAWVEHEGGIPPSQTRCGLAALVIIAGLVGLSIGRGPRGLTRLSAAALILLAVASVVGLYLAHLSGAIELNASSAEPATVAFVIVFVAAQAVWGLLLLPIASRVWR